MALIVHFFLGFISSFLGSLTPSMLNVTALKIGMERSKKDATEYSFGVSVIVLFQAYIAILMTQYISDNPTIIEVLEKVAVIIFMGLSVYFFYQSKKRKEQQDDKAGKKGKNNFATGLLLSTLNMFSIPFYCVTAAAFDIIGWVQFDQSNILLFVIGSALGTFAILLLYGNYSDKIQQRIGRLAKNINLILGFLTGIVAVFTIIRFYI